MDESDHLTLVNAGDEEVVSQEEGGSLREGGERRRGSGTLESRGAFTLLGPDSIYQISL